VDISGRTRTPLSLSPSSFLGWGGGGGGGGEAPLELFFVGGHEDAVYPLDTHPTNDRPDRPVVLCVALVVARGSDPSRLQTNDDSRELERLGPAKEDTDAARTRIIHLIDVVVRVATSFAVRISGRCVSDALIGRGIGTSFWAIPSDGGNAYQAVNNGY